MTNEEKLIQQLIDADLEWEYSYGFEDYLAGGGSEYIECKTSHKGNRIILHQNSQGYSLKVGSTRVSITTDQGEKLFDHAELNEDNGKKAELIKLID